MNNHNIFILSLRSRLIYDKIMYREKKTLLITNKSSCSSPNKNTVIIQLLFIAHKYALKFLAF